MKTLLLKVDKDIKRTVDVTENYCFVIVASKKGSYAVNFELNFKTPGVSASIIALYSLGGKQELNLSTVTNHLAPNTSCLTEVRGILDDSSISKYFGKIKISKKAQQTNSYLSHRVLVIGDKAINYSEPTLEIDANDVKASHGSTTGRINEDHIYYLQSRGLNLSEASKIISRGFLEASIDKISDHEIKGEVLKVLDIQ